MALRFRHPQKVISHILLHLFLYPGNLRVLCIDRWVDRYYRRWMLHLSSTYFVPAPPLIALHICLLSFDSHARWGRAGIIRVLQLRKSRLRENVLCVPLSAVRVISLFPAALWAHESQTPTEPPAGTLFRWGTSSKAVLILRARIRTQFWLHTFIQQRSWSSVRTKTNLEIC